jgi:Fungal chitosanase of glycosyl hydrolase group 75
MSRMIGTIHGSDIVEEDDGSVTFTSGASLDGDGANGQFDGDPCYAPSGYDGRTLDVIDNAGHQGNWFGVVTDTGEVTGRPTIQGENDPRPGAHVSATSLQLAGDDGNPLPRLSPFKYVDSATVPFIVVPPMIIRGVAGVVMGCRAVVTNRKNGKTVEAVVADSGPSNHLGEISVACAKALGIPTGGKHPANGGGAESGIKYQLFPGVPAVVNGVRYPLQRH